jgi:hypothetical protein
MAILYIAKCSASKFNFGFPISNFGIGPKGEKKHYAPPIKGDRKGGFAMKDATLGQAAKILSLFAETPSEQIQVILGSGLLADLRDGNVEDIDRAEFRRMLGLKFLNEPQSILDFLSTVTLPATTGKFIAKDKFAVGSNGISFLGDNFNSWFLAGKGKIEDPIVETTLRCHKLRNASLDTPIIAKLGGEAKAETTLTGIFALMERQNNGEEVLLTNGYANIFYVKDVKGVLRAVHVDRYDVGWDGDRGFHCEFV